MKLIKKFEIYNEEFNLVEAWEVDSNEDITGNSVWVDPEQLEYLKKKELIFGLAEDKYGTFPIYNEKDSEEIEKYIELTSHLKKYNI